MLRRLLSAALAAFVLALPAHAADVKPLVNSAGQIKPMTTGQTVGVANGGTGATTLTGLLKGNGASAVTAGNLSGDITSSALVTTYAGVVPASKGGAGTVSGILKANGSGTVSAATSGTDYAPITSGSALLYGNGAGGFSSATVGLGLAFSAGTLSRDHLGTPAISACGTSPSAVTGSDGAGRFTTGTATPTACTITFASAYSSAPACVVQDTTALANLTSYTVSTTAIVLTTSAASSQAISYVCLTL